MNCFRENPLSYDLTLCYTKPMSESVFKITEADTDGGFIARALGQFVTAD